MFQKLEHTQFKIFDMSVSDNKAKTHAWYTPLIYSRKHTEEEVIYGSQNKLICKTQTYIT